MQWPAPFADEERLHRGRHLQPVPFLQPGGDRSEFVAAERLRTSEYLQMLQALAPELAGCEPGELVAARVPSLPDVPAVGEFVPGFEVTTFANLGVPRNTPDAIVEKLNSEVNASLAVPALKQRDR